MEDNSDEKRKDASTKQKTFTNRPFGPAARARTSKASANQAAHSRDEFRKFTVPYENNILAIIFSTGPEVDAYCDQLGKAPAWVVRWDEGQVLKEKVAAYLVEGGDQPDFEADFERFQAVIPEIREQLRDRLAQSPFVDSWALQAQATGRRFEDLTEAELKRCDFLLAAQLYFAENVDRMIEVPELKLVDPQEQAREFAAAWLPPHKAEDIFGPPLHSGTPGGEQ